MSDTPISDAVTEAQAEGGLVEWQITVSSHSKTGYSAKLQAQGECFMVTEFKYLSESDNLSWQRGSHTDAAAALRLAAEKLSPDPTRRALEWMAWQLNHRSDMFGFSIDGICKVALAEADELDCDIDSWVSRAEKRAEEDAADV